ncbi:hypothetical protein PBCV1_A075cR [Paramecium bursaria Chlorella virus 1]|uniref:Uncharacterized protein n=1 Tax=Paramecium bursaria Chlorella virus 1 TaxID=10506 RepID=F8TTW8_PBCV1|nr:hypothetical protein PBCV1_A075cR [Paramecium bursaria Chlorella virus 1]AEI70029.1 hypothetical protein [Paramecium bursaria Chlorella virus 1]
MATSFSKLAISFFRSANSFSRYESLSSTDLNHVGISWGMSVILYINTLRYFI